MVKKSVRKFIHKYFDKLKNFKKRKLINSTITTENPTTITAQNNSIITTENPQSQIVQETVHGTMVDTYDTVISCETSLSYTSDYTYTSDFTDIVNDEATEYQSINDICLEPNIVRRKIKSSDGHYGAISDVPL